MNDIISKAPKSNLQFVFFNFAYAVLLFAALGIVGTTEAFSKLRFGPLYTLECVFLAWLFSVALSGLPIRKTLASILNQNIFLAVSVFFLWGMVRLAFDLFVHRSEITGFDRVLQHCILFVYPLLWVTAGYWLRFTSERQKDIFLFAILALNTLENLINRSDLTNIYAGPLSMIPLMFLLDSVINKRECSNQRVVMLKVIAILFFAAASFLGLWETWRTGLPFQRTSLMLTLFAIAAVPAFLNLKKPRKSLLPIVAGFGIFFGGAVAVSFYAENLGRPANTLGEKIVRGLQHGEDLPGGFSEHDPRYGFFVFRDRKAWWKNAARQWWSAPLTGVGFIPEVPDYLRDHSKNDGRFEGLPDMQNKLKDVGKPLSGPHNSYLTVLARMGIVGFVLLGWIFFLWLRAVWQNIKNLERDQNTLRKLVLIFIPLNGFVYAAIQIALESPRNCFLLWLFVGYLATTDVQHRNNTDKKAIA